MIKNKRDIIIEATIEELRKLYDDEGWNEYYYNTPQNLDHL